MMAGLGSIPTATLQTVKTDQRMTENKATQLSSPNGQAAAKNSSIPKSLSAVSSPSSLLASIDVAPGLLVTYKTDAQAVPDTPP